MKETTKVVLYIFSKSLFSTFILYSFSLLTFFFFPSRKTMMKDWALTVVAQIMASTDTSSQCSSWWSWHLLSLSLSPAFHINSIKPALSLPSACLSTIMDNTLGHLQSPDGSFSVTDFGVYIRYIDIRSHSHIGFLVWNVRLHVVLSPKV